MDVAAGAYRSVTYLFHPFTTLSYHMSELRKMLVLEFVRRLICRLTIVN